MGVELSPVNILVQYSSMQKSIAAYYPLPTVTHM